MPEDIQNLEPETSVMDEAQQIQEINQGVQDIGLQVADMYRLFKIPEDNTSFPGYVSSVYNMQVSIDDINQSLTSIIELQKSIDNHLSIIEGQTPESIDFSKIEKLLQASNKSVNNISASSDLLLLNMICIGFCVFFLTGFFIARHFFRRM